MTTSAPALPIPAGRTAGSVIRRRVGTLARGRAGDPRWVRPLLLLVLAVAAGLCLWNLTRNGYSNTYYAAAARSGSESWKAWFFGALDPGSFITVDKPPLSLWVMGLSARLFGFSSFSILLPEALCTIAAVGLLFATVRRSFGPAAGLIAAAALAITPVTVAIGRVNNPDALLVLTLVASAYMLQRALESGRTRSLVGCGALVGLAFMTKMLQGWMIVPALAAVYALAGPPRLATRVRQLALAGAAMVAVSAAWPVAVSLWPAASRPYIGGSTNGSIWNLIFGYNGFGRLTGNETGIGGGGGSPTFGGTTGLLRMFNEQVGGQVAWLIPLAGIGLLAGLWVTRRAPRTDRRRAALLLFGIWAAVLIAVFSMQKGIFHPYYVSALAPAIAALAGAGVVTLVRSARGSRAGLLTLDAAVVGSAVLAIVLLSRTARFVPWLRPLIAVAAAVAVPASLLARRWHRRVSVLVAAAAAAIALVAGPVAYSVASLGHSLSGNNVLAGPTTGIGAGPGGSAPSGAAGGPPAGPIGRPPSGASPTAPRAAAATPARQTRQGGGGGEISSGMLAYLEAHQGSAEYLVAASGSQTTAPLIIKTGRAVVTIGGFNGSDPAPTVTQLAALVAAGKLRYVLLSTAGGGPGGSSQTAVASWVREHGTAVTGLGTSSGTLYRVDA